MQVSCGLDWIVTIHSPFFRFLKDPSSPEMSENMHQSPDTPECAMPYRLSSAIHQESQSSLLDFDSPTPQISLNENVSLFGQSWKRGAWASWTSYYRNWSGASNTIRRRWLLNWHCVMSSSTRKNWRTRSFRCCWTYKISDGKWQPIRRNRRPMLRRQLARMAINRLLGSPSRTARLARPFFLTQTARSTTPETTVSPIDLWHMEFWPTWKKEVSADLALS